MTQRPLAQLPLLLAALALASLASGCFPTPTKSSPAAELTLYEGQVSCDAKTGRCTDSAGQPARGEQHRSRAQARVWRSGDKASLRFELRFARPGGARGRLLLALPLGAHVPSKDTPNPVVLYSETLAGQTTFLSSKVSGRVEVSVDCSCPCQVGRFELVFADPGPDGKLGTPDDRQRRLGAGRLRLDNRPFCNRRAVLPVKDGVLAVGLRACPVSGGVGAIGAGACAWGDDGWLDDGWNDDGWYDTSWEGEWIPDDTPDWDDGTGWEDDRGWDDGDDGWGGWEEEVPTGVGGGCAECSGAPDPWGGAGWDDGWSDWGGSGWGGGSSAGGSGSGSTGGGWDDPWGDSGGGGWGDSGDGWDDGSGWGGDDGWDSGDDGWDSGDDGWDSGDDGWDSGDDWGDDGWDDGGSDDDSWWD